jgi:hypothetical protein
MSRMLPMLPMHVMHSQSNHYHLEHCSGCESLSSSEAPAFATSPQKPSLSKLRHAMIQRRTRHAACSPLQSRHHCHIQS